MRRHVRMTELEELRSRVKNYTAEDGIPTTGIPSDMFPLPAYKLFAICGLCESYSAAKRLIEPHYKERVKNGYTTF